MILTRQSLVLPEPDQPLPGRSQPMRAPQRHYVLGTPMVGPFPEGLETAIVGMACSWGAGRKFWELAGVSATAAGYSAGYTPNPPYEETSTGRTGHAESVLVVFDPERVSYEEILRVFWENHDP